MTLGTKRKSGSNWLVFVHLLAFSLSTIFFAVLYPIESKAQRLIEDDWKVLFAASFAKEKIAPTFDDHYDISPESGFVHYFLFNRLLGRQENSPVVHLRVPQEYFRGSVKTVNQAWQASLLVRYLKDANAISPGDKSLFLCIGPCVERMIILISNRSGLDDRFKIKKVILSVLLEEMKTFSDDLTFSIEEVNGLIIYRTRYKSRDANIIAQDLYVERTESGEIGFIANCFPNNKYPLCEGYTESPPGSGVTVNYHFSMSHIHSYRNISDAIEKTVASWLVEILPPNSSKGSSSGR